MSDHSSVHGHNSCSTRCSVRDEIKELKEYIIKKEEYTEIEKKFLVSGDYKIHVKSSNKIIQGYISH